MRFGRTLREAAYAPWKDKYIDYGKLKSMLREDQSEDDDEPWTEDDENRFCDEVFNVQLEKVARFQEEEVARLRARVDAAFQKLKDLVPAADDGDGAGAGAGAGASKSEITAERLRELEVELDAITNDVKELKKYSNLNYTGFLKIVKKHDRKRGQGYRIRPMMQMSLSKRPFNSEHVYSAMLNKISLVYFAIRQHTEDPAASAGAQHDVFLPDLATTQPEIHNGERYTAHKFWVHPDNLLEVKTYIMRRLPALVYGDQSARELDGTDDPTITSLYFDSHTFDLYAKKLDRDQEATSLRLRWYGQLSTRPEIRVEQKTVHEDATSEERKILIKDKYVKAFLDGQYKMEKTLQKMERQGQSPEAVAEFKSTADGIQQFLRDAGLEPVLRANYVRTAFQKPGDTRVRISIDTDIAFIREDTLDRDRPCRDPSSWHRTDIDDSNMSYPFKNINQSEVSRFPYAVLEIKLKEDSNRRRPAWIEDLMASHLVHPAPLFSKFVHGVASLFEDYVNRLPFWLSDLDTDIRKDPQVAFEEEEERRAAMAESELVVGSFLGTKVGGGGGGSSYKPSRSSPISKSYLAERAAAESRASPAAGAGSGPGHTPAAAAEEHPLPPQRAGSHYGTISSVFPGFSLTKYSRAKRARERNHGAPLPAGVVEPTEWIKNSGPLKIEPKVWLANERTFLKWQQICVLLGSLAVSLYAAAGERNVLAAAMGLAFLAVAAFAGGWGYWQLRVRRAMIVQRSGRDFDNMVGPMVVSVALMAALVLNFAFAYSAALKKMLVAVVVGGPDGEFAETAAAMNNSTWTLGAGEL